MFFTKKIGIEHLLISQDVFTLEASTVKVIEILMLLESESYLKGTQGCGDIGNGSYPRSFKALNKNSLLVNIPRTRSGHFKPMTIELLKIRILKPTIGTSFQYMLLLIGLKNTPNMARPLILIKR